MHSGPCSMQRIGYRPADTGRSPRHQCSQAMGNRHTGSQADRRTGYEVQNKAGVAVGSEQLARLRRTRSVFIVTATPACQAIGECMHVDSILQSPGFCHAPDPATGCSGRPKHARKP